MTATICPHCGFSLGSLDAIRIDALLIDRGGSHVWWREHVVKLTLAERLILIAIVRADGAPVRRTALAEASGYDGEAPEQCVAVLLHRIRKAFRKVDPAFDRIESIQRAGVRWRVGSPVNARRAPTMAEALLHRPSPVIAPDGLPAQPGRHL